MIKNLLLLSHAINKSSLPFLDLAFQSKIYLIESLLNKGDENK